MPKTWNRFRLYIHSCCVFCCSCVPQRFVVYGLTSAASFVCFFQRQTFYQALSDIFDQGSLEEAVINSKCPRMISYYERDRRIFLQNYQPWKPSQITGTTRAFFIGFIVFLVPGGVMADKYGGKIIMGIGIAIATVVTTVLPNLIELGPSALACGRLLQGLAQGLVFPSISAITAQWAPASERTLATGIIYSGQFFGWAAGYWVRFQYTKYSLQWHFQFYLCAGMGLVWLIIWVLFSFSKPSYCSYLKKTELEKIKSGSIGGYDREVYDRMISIVPLFVPWKEIICSFPVLSLIVINWAGLWIHYTMMNLFRFYFLNVIGLTHELSNDSVEFSHFVLGVSTFFWGFICDWLINHNYTSRTMNRRLFAVISNILVIPFMMSILMANCQGRVVACLYLTINFIRGPFYASLRSNVIDLSPHFAGTLNGIVHSTGALVALFSWDFFWFIVEDSSDTTQWGYLFMSISAILLFFSLPYLFLGSGDFQAWDLKKLRQFYMSDSHENINLQEQNTS